MSRRPREQVDYLHLEELGGLEMLKASYFQQEFSRHVHEGFCIGVIEEGAQRFYRTGGNHVAPQGDIILVNADEVHTAHQPSKQVGVTVRSIQHQKFFMS